MGEMLPSVLMPCKLEESSVSHRPHCIQLFHAGLPDEAARTPLQCLASYALRSSRRLTTPAHNVPAPPQNSLRLLAVTVIGDLLLFLGKVAVAAGCGLAAFGMSELEYYTNATKYPNTYLSRYEESGFTTHQGMS